MKAIVLAIFLLTPAIVISPCNINPGNTANVAGPQCATCVAFVSGTAGAAVACATCNAGYKLISTSLECDGCPIATYSALGNSAMTCTNCTANTDTATTGTTATTGCTACIGGKYSTSGTAC